MSITRHIPNFLTSINLFLGAVGTFLAVSGRPDLTAWCIIIAALFDFADGFAARILKAYSDIGKDLDSLADLVSFGVAPAAVFSSFVHFHYTGVWGGEFFNLTFTQQILVILPFVLTVFSALRLAKFNNDSRQTESFIGLTTTATGMFTVSLAYLVFTGNGSLNELTNPLYVYLIVTVFCFLLVSEIPMFSLKFKSFKFAQNKHRYVILFISILALAVLGLGALAVIIPLYVAYSLALMILKKQ
jgi:CDP-diacylglycerol---serine O-phosphatidyltransferase